MEEDLAVAVGASYGRSLRAYRRSDGEWEEKSVLLGTNANGMGGGRAIAVDGERVMARGAGGEVQMLTIGTSSAEVRTRNLGTNPPDSLRVEPLGIGGRLSADVDLPGVTVVSRVFAFDSKLELVLPGGQALLCHDGGGSGAIFNFNAFASGISFGGFEVPPTSELVGFSFTVQAYNPGTNGNFLLTNAVDVTIGACDCP